MYDKSSNDNDCGQCPSGSDCPICNDIHIDDLQLMGDNLHVAFAVETDNPDWIAELLRQLGAANVVVERVA